MRAELKQLTAPFLVSLSFHVLLLGLTFGDAESGLTGLDFAWRQRRIEAPRLNVELAPAPIAAAEPARTSGEASRPPASTERTVAPRPNGTVFSAPTPPPTGSASVARQVEAKGEAVPVLDDAMPAAMEQVHADGSSAAARAPIPEAESSSNPRPVDAGPALAPAEAASTPVIAVAPDAPSPDAVTAATPASGEVVQQRAELEAPQRAAELPKPGLPGPKMQEALEQAEAASDEAERLEAARREAARIETARLEAARREAARIEAERREAARIEAERLEAERLEAARMEAARAEAERQEAARQAAARQESARALEEQEEDARREARRRAMARQLEEEAARRAAASNAAGSPSTLPYSLSSARRVRLWGRIHDDTELVQYAEAWAAKIQLNTAVEAVREVASRPHTAPLVTVAIRSDGSVESVNFEISSGLAEIDEAIRRIVEAQRPYAPFPPALAREFDVIEIRRTWHFDTALRLH